MSVCILLRANHPQNAPARNTTNVPIESQSFYLRRLRVTKTLLLGCFYAAFVGCKQSNRRGVDDNDWPVFAGAASNAARPLIKVQE